jgi:regulator of sirC expression with transglutaminase-like and TPR domain
METHSLAPFLAAFDAERQMAHPRLDRLALLLGGIEAADLAIEPYVDRVEGLVAQVGERLDPEMTSLEQAWVLLSMLHDEFGFQGNRRNYYDSANSYLHHTLDSRRGLPITLSMLYMAVAEPNGLHLTGMGFPGHFMLAITQSPVTYYIDPFYRAILAEDEVALHLSDLFQQPVPLQQPLHVYAVDVDNILLRALNNLRLLYLRQQELSLTEHVLSFMTLLAPDEPGLWRERGAIRFKEGHFLAAEGDLRRYCYLTNQLHEFVNQRPVAHMQPPIINLNPGPKEFSRDDLELFALVDEIRRTIARQN